MIITFFLFILVFSTPAYVYGVAVGMRSGKRIGRAQADAEWAVIL